MTTEELISNILSDIHLKGYSSIQPFSIGKVEERMAYFAQVNNIELASDELYMSAKQLQHSMRASKNAKGLVVSDEDLINFPKNRFTMDLYYDGECFIYTDGASKFIVHPNYKMKINREEIKMVNFITATRRIDKKEFNGKRYVKIESDYAIEWHNRLYVVKETKRQGRIAHHHTDATVPHIVALLGFSFHIAKIRISEQTTK